MASNKTQSYSFYHLAPRLTENRWSDGVMVLLNKVAKSFHKFGKIYFLLGLILSQAEFISVFAPFAPAFYLAVRRKAPVYTWSTAAGMLLGAGLGKDWQHMFAWTLLFALATSWQVDKSRLQSWRDYFQAFVPTWVIAIVSLGLAEIAWELSGYSLMIAALNSVLTTGAALLFWDTPVLFTSKSQDRPVPGWGFFLLAVGIMVGLSQVQFSAFSLGEIWLHFFILNSAWALGPSLGLASAVGLGIVAALGGMMELSWLSTEVSACLLAGCFRSWGKPSVALSYTAGILVMGLPFGMEMTQSDWISLALSLFLFGITPAKWLFEPLRTIGKWMRQNDLWQHQTDDKSPELALAGGYELIHRLEGFASVFRQMAFSFQQTASVTEEQEKTEMATVIEQVSQVACRGCPAFELCWKQEFFQTYQSMAEQLGRVENGLPPKQSGFRPNRRVLCHRPSEVGKAIYYLHQLVSLNERWQTRLDDTRELVAAQLEGVSLLLDDMAQEEGHWFDKNPGIAVRGEPFLDYRLAVAKSAKFGSVVSGDSHSVKERKGQLMMLLSDGMGVGTRAAMESTATLSLFEKVLDLGFPIDTTIKLVNSVLLLRSQEEVFATLDLAIIDLYQAQAQFMKIGAAAAFIKRGSRVGVIRSQCLPLGILNTVDVELLDQELEPGDMLIMISDGILEARKELEDKEGWIQQFLSDCSETDPQALAERVLREASAMVPAREQDDMTVMVARFIRNHYF